MESPDSRVRADQGPKNASWERFSGKTTIPYMPAKPEFDFLKPDMCFAQQFKTLQNYQQKDIYSHRMTDLYKLDLLDLVFDIHELGI